MPVKKAAGPAAESMDAMIGPMLAAMPELRDEAASLIRESLAAYRLQLRTGDAPTRLALLRATVPAIFRSAASSGGDEGMAAMRADFDAMRGELRQALSPQPRKPVAPVKAAKADKPKPAVRVTRPKRAGGS